jgi:hypothetical protein
VDSLDEFLLASLWDSGLSIGCYPLPQICPMVLDFRPEIQPLGPGSANPCYIKLPTWMLEYAEDANAIHALTNGMEFGCPLLLKKHDSSDERCNHLALGCTHLAQGRSSQIWPPLLSWIWYPHFD